MKILIFPTTSQAAIYNNAKSAQETVKWPLQAVNSQMNHFLHFKMGFLIDYDSYWLHIWTQVSLNTPHYYHAVFILISGHFERIPDPIRI